jgi:hypothetical protein
MIPCPWRFSTESSFGALPTRQGQGIVSPLHLKVIYGQASRLSTIEGWTNLQNKSEEPGTREMLLQTPGLIRIFLNFSEQFFFRGAGKSTRRRRPLPTVGRLYVGLPASPSRAGCPTPPCDQGGDSPLEPSRAAPHNKPRAVSAARRAGVVWRRGSQPARSGLAASTAGEEPRQDPARNWPETGKRIVYSISARLYRCLSIC